MPILLIFVLTLGIILGWTISRKWIASRVRPHLAALDSPYNSSGTRRVAASIARVIGA